jgi:DNA gyrase subunit A
MNLANLLPLEQEEKVKAVIPVRDDEEVGFLFMATKNGVVKRTRMDKFASAGRKAGLIALTIEDGDELIAVRKTDGQQAMLLATREGKVICFPESEVRDMGRTARGVTGIRMTGEDFVIGAARARSGAALLTVTENGYGKRTEIDEYKRGGEVQHRGGKGLRNQTLNDKTGMVAGIRVVDEEDDILLISDDGTIIRMAASEINLYSRTAQGVILMRTGDNSRVIALARTFKEEEDGAPDAAQDSGIPLVDGSAIDDPT